MLLRPSAAAAGLLAVLAFLPFAWGVTPDRVDPRACHEAAVEVKPLAEPPLERPFRTLCATPEFARLIARWGPDNLTVSEQGHRVGAGAAPLNATRDGGGALVLDGAQFTLTWIAPCQGSAEPCVFAEWWTATLPGGALSGPFGGEGHPPGTWHFGTAIVEPPRGSA